jgi:dTDP-4-amino-4,6-dideoxygalactose transaminase
LSSLEEIEFLEEPEGVFSNRWLSCILTPSYTIREQIRSTLEAEEIESRPLWKPMHLQPVFNGCGKYLNGISADLFERGLCLPSGSSLQQEDLERVVYLIKKSIL